MALDRDIFDADLAEVIDDMSEDMTWTPAGGTEQTIEVAVSSRAKQDDLKDEIAGVLEMEEVQVLARVSRFTDSIFPEPGERVGLRGTTFRVSRSVQSTCRKQVGLNLVAVAE